MLTSIKDFKIYRNSKTFKTHIVSPGYMQAWCGAWVKDYYSYSDRGYCSAEWIDKAIDNRDNRMCKRCSSMWRSGR